MNRYDKLMARLAAGEKILIDGATGTEVGRRGVPAVSKAWNSGGANQRFFAAIHSSACKRFGTVLSPNYNGAHRDHFHFDMSGNGFCR